MLLVLRGEGPCVGLGEGTLCCWSGGRGPVFLVLREEWPCVVGLSGEGAEANLGKGLEHWKPELEGPTVTGGNCYCHLP